MGRKCSVYNCRTGYVSPKSEEKVTVYSFPKDNDERRVSITSLPNKLSFDEVTQYMGVCALHCSPDTPFIRRGRQLVPMIRFSNHCNSSSKDGTSEQRRKVKKLSSQ